MPDPDHSAPVYGVGRDGTWQGPWSLTYARRLLRDLLALNGGEAR